MWQQHIQSRRWVVGIRRGPAVVAAEAAESGGPGASGVQGSKRIDQLTQTEAAILCDFAAQEFGGYGTIMNCGDGTTIEADANQAECVASRPTTCAMTVSQYEVCISEVSCANFLPASCAPLLQCS